LKVNLSNKKRITLKEEHRSLPGKNFEFELLAFEKVVDLGELAESQAHLDNVDERGVISVLNLGEYQDLLKNKG